MGWCGGTEVASEFVELCDKYVPRHCQFAFLKKAFTSLEDMDWDCQGDLLGDIDVKNPTPIDKVVLKVLNKMHPGWFEDEEPDPEDDRDDS